MSGTWKLPKPSDVEECEPRLRKIVAKTLSKDRVMLVAPDDSSDIVIFMLPDGSANACIAQDGDEVVSFKIDAPEPGRQMVIVRGKDGSVEVQYRDV
jgi:hypothetical protein